PAGSIPDGLSIYVVLCYRECETDTVPIPSEDCRTDEESMAGSRIADSFELRLALQPPQPAGEVAGDGLAATIDRLLALVESPPPEFPGLSSIRDELIAWASELRPEVDGNACLSAPDENCDDRPSDPSTGVLLARIDLDIDEDPSGNVTVSTDPIVEYDHRPVLMSTRFLQEWLTQLMAHPDVLLGLEDLALNDLSDVNTAGQALDHVLTFDGTGWIAAPSQAGTDDHNALSNLATGDVHTQYLPADGSRPLTGDLDAGGNRVTNLSASAGGSDAMRRDEVVGGDLIDDPAGLRIAELQGSPVAAGGPNAPNPDEALVFRAGAWRPTPLPPPAAPALGAVLPFVTIELIGRVENTSVFSLWFNIDVPDNDVAVLPRTLPPPIGDGLEYGRDLVVFSEECNPAPDGTDLNAIRRDRVAVRFSGFCNVFRAEVNRRFAPYLRFRFNLEEIELSTGQTAFDYTRDRGITWVGQDGRATVTKFVMNPSPAEVNPGFEERFDIPTRGGGGLLNPLRG
ncbi:MAG: hypothetical protein OES24_23325, partial [Acidimicrobiia bacterium]|nr:hypothetical protein [Acidimicrobiia bacterium]